MSYCLGQIILVASKSYGEYAFWIQMLVLVILVTLLGIYSLTKTRAKQLGDQQQGYPGGGSGPHTQPSQQIKFDGRDIASPGKVRNELGKGRDLGSGMEMLELDFLVGIVEKTKGDDKSDVTMRKLGFNELLRRGQLKAADSKAIKVYAMNESNLYGKDIQCEAMKELTERTGLRSG